jgi:hypothetical protein
MHLAANIHHCQVSLLHLQLINDNFHICFLKFVGIHKRGHFLKSLKSPEYF